MKGGITNDLDIKLRQAIRIHGRVAIDGHPPAYLVYYERFKNYTPALEFLEHCREWMSIRQKHNMKYNELLVDFLQACVLTESSEWIVSDREAIRSLEGR